MEDVDREKRLDKLPFQHSWVWVDREQLKDQSVYLPPIRLDLLPKDEWRNSLSAAITSEQDFSEAVRSLADYFHEKLLAEMEAIPDRRWVMATRLGPGVAKIEIAITELQFSHPVSRAATYLSPVPGTGMALSTVSDPHVAFAMRITDAATGQLIATAADRKFSPLRIVDLNKLTATSSTREICANWAKMIAETFQRGHLETIENRGVFSILPW